ncbi:nitrate reductase [Alsobacter sp. SYSU BS001988]
MTATRTTCPYCGVGCGVLATPDGRGGAGIAGDPEHPANFGRLCSKGSALGETLGLETRLLHPMMRDGRGALRRARWDAALDRVAEGFATAIRRHGPDSVAFYLSGQLLTEDYYVANKLMKGFIGSANVDTNSRLCMASSVAGHKRAFGSDTVPGAYEDLDRADLLVLVGSNAAWCHPILHQRMQAARQARGATLVVIDPRGSATGEGADLHLPVRHGQDATLFAGLLVHLADQSRIDRAYVDAHTAGFDEALAAARILAPDLETAAARTGVPAADLARFYALWAGTERVVTLYSQGVNQAAQGVDKVNAILNCHLATGRIGREGMGPFSLTGQPNAMGGREVGGLANQLAAHMGFSPEEVARVGAFWGAPRMATREGLKAVQLFEAVERGAVKALWVMGTNPAVSLPRADAMRAALSRLDLLVVSENVASTDTTSGVAHVLLPAAAWGEKDGTVTNSERRISRQRAFLPLPGEAKPDWWALSQVAERLGWGDAFAYDGPAAIFREHAALSAHENDGARDFDIGGLAALTGPAYDGLRPTQWPMPAAARPSREGEGEAAGSSSASGGAARLFGDGRFFTPDGRARFVAVGAASAPATTSDYPLVLNTGRVRDQWHTMTRTGLSPRLGAHRPEPTLEAHPRDAARFGLVDGGLARVTSAHGAATLRVAVTASQAPGGVFAPIHWNGETASDARVGSLVHAVTDPVSGQPDSKATPCRVEPVAAPLTGFVLSRRRFPLPREAFWAWAAIEGGFAARIAGDLPAERVGEALAAAFPDAETARYLDAAASVSRLACFAHDRLAAVAYLERDGEEPGWSGLLELWRKPRLDRRDRLAALSGAAAPAGSDEGPTVCACFGVGANRIRAAIRNGCRDAAAIGASLKAGTNCGSCIPELKRLVTEDTRHVALAGE